MLTAFPVDCPLPTSLSHVVCEGNVHPCNSLLGRNWTNDVYDEDPDAYGVTGFIGQRQSISLYSGAGSTRKYYTQSICSLE